MGKQHSSSNEVTPKVRAFLRIRNQLVRCVGVYPHLRIGQLIDNAITHTFGSGHSLFYMPDEELEQALKAFADARLG